MTRLGRIQPRQWPDVGVASTHSLVGRWVVVPRKRGITGRADVTDMSKNARNTRQKAAAVRAAEARAQRTRRWTMVGVAALVVAVIVGGAVWYAGQDPTGQSSTTSSSNVQLTIGM